MIDLGGEVEVRGPKLLLAHHQWNSQPRFLANFKGCLVKWQITFCIVAGYRRHRVLYGLTKVS
jgi:hypothetical protein